MTLPSIFSQKEMFMSPADKIIRFLSFDHQDLNRCFESVQNADAQLAIGITEINYNKTYRGVIDLKDWRLAKQEKRAITKTEIFYMGGDKVKTIPVMIATFTSFCVPPSQRTTLQVLPVAFKIGKQSDKSEIALGLKTLDSSRFLRDAVY